MVIFLNIYSHVYILHTMPRLFYKDMREHENAYRHERADEATNDLILGAKVSAYTGFEEAKDKAIDEIATNYGKFLKALKVKDIPLANAPEKVAKKEEQIINTALSTAGTNNSLMPTSQQKTMSSTLTPSQLGADYTPQQQAVIDAYNIAQNNHSVSSALSQIKTVLAPVDMVSNLETVLHMLGYRASTGKNKRGVSTLHNLTITGLQQGIEGLQREVFTPH
jgi:hypothetical protein